MFEEEEEQAEVASIFNTELERVESRAEREKALKEIVLGIKRNSIENSSRDDAGFEGMMKALEDKKKLEKLQNIKFNLD